MTDQLGALSLPVSGDADPLLGYLLGYLQSVVNARCSAAWAELCHDRSSVIKTVRQANPADVMTPFVERELPCLFGWRGDGDSPYWRAEDILVRPGKVQLLWVMHPLPAEKHARRTTFVNAVNAAATIAIELGRDPAWIVEGDTDSQAATMGSVFYRWANVAAISISKWSPKVFIVDNPEARERYPFAALEAVVDVEEELVEDLERYAPLEGAELTITNENGTLDLEHASFP